MLNLLKAEFYQLTHRRAPKAWLFVGFLLGLVLPILYYLVMWLDEGAQPKLGVFPAAIAVNIALIPVLTSTAIFLLIGLSGTAYNDETRLRTLINTVSTGHPRRTVYVSKLITSFCFALCFYVIATLGFILSGLIIFSGGLDVYVQPLYVTTLLDYLPIWLMYLALYLIIHTNANTNGMMNLMLIVIVALPLILELLSLKLDIIQTIAPYIFTQLDPNSPVLIGSVNLTPYLALGYTLLFSAIGSHLFKRKEIK